MQEMISFFNANYLILMNSIYFSQFVIYSKVFFLVFFAVAAFFFLLTTLSCLIFYRPHSCFFPLYHLCYIFYVLLIKNLQCSYLQFHTSVFFPFLSISLINPPYCTLYCTYLYSDPFRDTLVEDVMTPASNVFMLPDTECLTYQVV